MQRIYSLAMGLCALCFVLLGFASTVWAATEARYTFDLAPLLDALMHSLLGGVSLLASMVLAWLLRLLARYTGVVLDEKHRKTLHEIVVSRLQQILTDSYEGNRSAFQVSTKSEVVAELAGYAARKAPGAIRHFKLDQQGLEEFVAGRVGAKTLARLKSSPRHGPSHVPPKPSR
jgi:peptidoglycan hydrolase-like protein with peptidoglycan-binding domain